MQVECPQCGKSLNDSHIDARLNIVTCPACGAVFSAPNSMSAEYEQKSKAKFEQVPIPDKIRVLREFDHIQFSYKHNACMGIVLGVFALFWNGIIWMVFVPSFGMVGLSAFSGGTIQWEALLFPLFLIPFVLVGIFIALQALVSIFNTTTIRVDKQALQIIHRPIPMPLDKNIPSDEIEQIYTKQHVTHSSNGTQITYQLHMVRRDGKSKKLLGQLPDAMQALYLEQEIEDFLRIQDRPVGGEYR